jgi:hypothetical protein
MHETIKRKNIRLFCCSLIWFHSYPLLSSEGEHEHGTQRVERLREREGNIAGSADGRGGRTPNQTTGKKLWSPSLFSLFSACFRLGSSKHFAYVHAIALVKTSDNIFLL